MPATAAHRIRIPASACGVFGLKPSRARNPLGPDRGEGWGGFACGHVVSISVRDSAVMLDAVCGPEASSPYVAPQPERPFAQEVGRDPGKLRIAFTDRSLYGEAVDPEIAAAVRDVVTLLAGLGHHVEKRAPGLATDPGPVMGVIVGKQHRAQRAVDRTASRPRDDGGRLRNIDAGDGAERASANRDRLCRGATTAPSGVRAAPRRVSQASTSSCARRNARAARLSLDELNPDVGRSRTLSCRSCAATTGGPAYSTCPASPRCRCRSPGTRPD